MATRALAAATEVIDVVAPYALAVVVILLAIGFVLWVFNRWNQEPPF